MSRIWVADTSAIIEVRRIVSSTGGVFKELQRLVDEGRFVFPPETYRELKDGNSKIRKSPDNDPPYSFARKIRKTAERNADLHIVQELGRHELVRRVVDPHAETDEADIYVLAVALDLDRSGYNVGVLTEERRDIRGKLSLNTACGVLGLVCLPMRAFLHEEGIWTYDFSMSRR